jgi:hypothetical protein
MKRTPSQIEQELKASPELLRLLTAKPDLFQKILAASFIAEQFEAIRASYLSQTEEGFTAMSDFIALLEIPVSPVTGDPMTNEAGTEYLFPLADPTSGESLYSRFARWHHGRLFNADSTPKVAWDDEQKLPESVTELERWWEKYSPIEKTESGGMS